MTPVPPRDARPELTALTALRGVAALWVVAFHLRDEIPSVAPVIWPWVSAYSRNGALGVDLFFVLSGFVIAYTYYEAFDTSGLRKYAGYVRKRFARIYPAYATMVLIAVAQQYWPLLMSPDDASARLRRISVQALEQLLMVQGWRFPIERTWNIISWSVSAEWLAYLVFPALVACVTGLRTVRALLAAAAALCIAAMLTLNALDDGGNMRMGLLRIAFAFPVGVLVQRLYALQPAPTRAWGVAGLAVLVGFAPAAALLPRGFDAVGIAPAAFGFAVYGLARGSLPWTNHRVLQWMGHTSYCLYLVHIEVLQAVRAALPPPVVAAYGNAAGLAYLALCVGCAMAAGHVLYAWVEKPWRARLLRVTP